eukprot:GHRR01021041.1.p2 GENE.GHRR01021041.1~~GHRR01021041.1.p2  ORF type:complete len:108 (+),score=30.61 GHRR01021041.1:601-924(+)
MRACVCWQDMLDIVDLEGKREPGKYPTRQGGFDLIWDNSPISQFDKPTSIPTMLGCYNYRDQNQVRRSLAEVLREDAEGVQDVKYARAKGEQPQSSGQQPAAVPTTN